MDYKKINNLLEKYWEGETTLQEEATLRQYFNEADVAEELLPFQPLFKFFREEQENMVGEDFENKLLEKLRMEETPQVRRIDWFKNVRRIAAAAIILLGSFFIYKSVSTPDEVDRFAKYDAKTEQEAYERTKAALALISNKINKGANQATKGLVEVREATNAVK